MSPNQELYSAMLRIRRFEERCAELYSKGSIRGFLHLYIGEEAIAAGALSVLERDDAVVSTYRDHGHALARGVPMTALMAEMFGKVQGCSRGRGGSMHLFDASRRFYGGNAIVAGGLPIAVGLALADQLQGRRRITACFFGDGAVAEGAFHESMNLASLWRLPVLFLCENNLYAMGTRLDRHQAQVDLSTKAAGYRMSSERVDGMDVRAVRDAVARAATSVRETRAPCFLELQTYRFRAHSMFDAELYRDKTEVDRWKERDPLSTFRRQLFDEGELDAAGAARAEELVQRELQHAVDFAEAGTLEPIEELHRWVYARGSGS